MNKKNKESYYEYVELALKTSTKRDLDFVKDIAGFKDYDQTIRWLLDKYGRIK